jgi:hypothetical protein
VHRSTASLVLGRFRVFLHSVTWVLVLREPFLRLAETLRPHQAVIGIGISLRNRTRL